VGKVKEIPQQKNTIHISYTIAVAKDVDQAFHYIIHNLSKNYSALADGHEYFQIINSDSLEVGSIVECSERAGNQSIMHTYIVEEIIKDERIHYVSTPSYVKVILPWKTIESTSNTYVYYDFARSSENSTEIRLTIGIQFSSAFEKIFSQITGGLIPWRKHCREEMEGLKQLLEDSD
jgi:hypothetical protein